MGTSKFKTVKVIKNFLWGAIPPAIMAFFTPMPYHNWIIIGAGVAVLGFIEWTWYNNK